MASVEATTRVLNDLIGINLDRMAGYEHAIHESEDLDADLKGVFESFIRESSRNKQELENKVIELGGQPETDTTTAGSIYHFWMDLKAAFTGDDRRAIIESCEYGEDAAEQAYIEALDKSVSLDICSVFLIRRQKESINRAHELIKHYKEHKEYAH
jgi:uncharacterized protein (TIGR02284 family)